MKDWYMGALNEQIAELEIKLAGEQLKYKALNTLFEYECATHGKCLQAKKTLQEALEAVERTLRIYHEGEYVDAVNAAEQALEEARKGLEDIGE